MHQGHTQPRCLILIDPSGSAGLTTSGKERRLGPTDGCILLARRSCVQTTSVPQMGRDHPTVGEHTHRRGPGRLCPLVLPPPHRSPCSRVLRPRPISTPVSYHHRTHLQSRRTVPPLPPPSLWVRPPPPNSSTLPWFPGATCPPSRPPHRAHPAQSLSLSPAPPSQTPILLQPPLLHPVSSW